MKACKSYRINHTKYKTQKIRHCIDCRKSRSNIRKFGRCRVCIRLLSNNCLIPGIRRYD